MVSMITKVTRGGKNVAYSPRFWENFGKNWRGFQGEVWGNPDLIEDGSGVGMAFVTE